MDARNKLITQYIGTIKGVVAAYAMGFDQDRWDDLFGAAMEGAAKALNSYDLAKGEWSQHLRRSCRNSVVDELRKIKRWNNEVADSKCDDGDDSDDRDPGFMNNQSESVWYTGLLLLDEVYMVQEIIEMVWDMADEAAHTLNTRQRKILLNLLMEEPQTLLEIANDEGVSRPMVSKDKRTVLNTLKEVANGSRFKGKVSEVLS